jgi:hypothetical protein
MAERLAVEKIFVSKSKHLQASTIRIWIKQEAVMLTASEQAKV